MAGGSRGARRITTISSCIITMNIGDQPYFHANKGLAKYFRPEGVLQHRHIGLPIEKMQLYCPYAPEHLPTEGNPPPFTLAQSSDPA